MNMNRKFKNNLPAPTANAPEPPIAAKNRMTIKSGTLLAAPDIAVKIRRIGIVDQ